MFEIMQLIVVISNEDMSYNYQIFKDNFWVILPKYSIIQTLVENCTWQSFNGLRALKTILLSDDINI